MESCGCPGPQLQAVPEPVTRTEGGKDKSCRQCDQVEDLLRLVAQLTEDVGV